MAVGLRACAPARPRACHAHARAERGMRGARPNAGRSRTSWRRPSSCRSATPSCAHAAASGHQAHAAARTQAWHAALPKGCTLAPPRHPGSRASAAHRATFCCMARQALARCGGARAWCTGPACALHAKHTRARARASPQLKPRRVCTRHAPPQTLLVEKLAAEAGFTLLALSPSSILSKWRAGAPPACLPPPPPARACRQAPSHVDSDARAPSPAPPRPRRAPQERREREGAGPGV